MQILTCTGAMPVAGLIWASEMAILPDSEGLICHSGIILGSGTLLRSVGPGAEMRLRQGDGTARCLTM